MADENNSVFTGTRIEMKEIYFLIMLSVKFDIE